MKDSSNREIWSRHYETGKSRQVIPDENIVRFYQHYLRNHPENSNPYVLEVGSGSGRNLAYLQAHTKHAFGMDFALNILSHQENVVCALSNEIPFAECSFDIVIAWGVLHYLSDENIRNTISEMKRVLKKSGRIWGTIRSAEDTHLKTVLSKGDLENGSARLFHKKEVLELFSGFSEIKLGFIMRQNPGDERIIAHHTFELRI